MTMTKIKLPVVWIAGVAGEVITLQVKAGHKYIIAGHVANTTGSGGVVSTRQGQDLVLNYIDGRHITLRGFNVATNVEAVLTG